jgi:acetyl-CoA carboxylase carboxyltransferase component
MPYEKTWEKELSKLERKEAEACLGGGKERLEKQRASGKMTARERVEYLLDPGSFGELNMLAEHQCRDFGMEKKKFLGDGVVTGHGTILGRKVFIYSEDSTVLGGSTGKTHGAKIHYVLRMARECMVPVICLNDGAGNSTRRPSIPGLFRRSPPSWVIAPEGPSIRPPFATFSSRWKRRPTLLSPVRRSSKR